MSSYLQRLVSRAAGLPTPVRPRGAHPDSPPAIEESLERTVEVGAQVSPVSPHFTPAPVLPDPAAEAWTRSGQSTPDGAKNGLGLESPAPVELEVQPAFPPAEIPPPKRSVTESGTTLREVLKPAVERTPREPTPLPSSPRPDAALRSLRPAEPHAESPTRAPEFSGSAAPPEKAPPVAPAIKPASTPPLILTEPAREPSPSPAHPAEPRAPAVTMAFTPRPGPSAAESDLLQVIEQVLVREAGARQAAVRPAASPLENATPVREPVAALPPVQVRIGRVEIRGLTSRAPGRPGRSGFADLELARRYLDRSGY